VSNGFNKIKTQQEALNTSLLKGHKLISTNTQDTQQYLKVTQQLQKGNWIKDIGVYIDKATGKMYQFQNAQRNIMVDTITWEKALVTAGKRILQWTVSTSVVFGTISAFKQMITVIQEVDKSLTEVNKVLDLNADKLKSLSLTAVEVGQEYGRTTNEVLSAIGAFAKAGMDEKVSTDMAKLALLLGNVGDMSIDSAQETLIAANAGYQLGNSYSSLLGIIDKFNEIANKNATEVSSLSEAWKVSAATAKLAGLSIDEYTALVGTAQSVTQRSGSEIGNAWKTILMRMQGVADGTDTLEEDLSKAEEALNSIGIAVRETPDKFRPAMVIISEFAQKYKELEEAGKTVQLNYVTEALAGKYRANILKSTLQNFDMVNKQLNESMNASGSALRENERYMQSLEARIKQLTVTYEKLAIKFVSSDFLKGLVSSVTEFLNVVDRVTTGLGGFNTVLLLTISTFGVFKAKAIVDFIETLILIGLEAKKTTLAMALFRGTTIALGTSIKTLGASLLALLSNPVTWLVAALVAIPAGIIAWTNHNQKLIEQQKELASAQTEFNNTLKDFYQTLENTNLSKLISDLEKIKETVKYDETIKKIDEIKTKLASLSEKGQNKTRFGRLEYKDLTDELNKLEKQIQPVTEAQAKLKKATEDLKEPFIVNNGIIVLNKELLEQWAISKSEITQDMLKNTIILAEAELKKETEILNKRLANYNLEIEGLKTLAEVKKAAYVLAYEDTSESSDMGISMNIRSGLANSYENSIKNIKDKQDYLKNLTLRVNANFSTYTPRSGSKTSTKTPIEYEDMSAERIKSYNYQVEEDKLDSEILEKKIKLAAKQKDYNKEISLSNQLLQNQQKTIKDIEIANSKILAEQQTVKSRTKYNTDEWFDPTGEASLKYKELLNSFAGKTDNASKVAKRDIEDIFKSLYSLKKAWKDNENQIESMNEALDSTKQSIEDIKKTADETLEKNFDTTLKSISKSISLTISDLRQDQEKEYNKMKKALDDYKDSQEKIIKQKQTELDLLKEQYDLEDRIKKLNEINEEIAKVQADNRFEYINAQGLIEYTYDKEKYNELIKERQDLVDEYAKDDVIKAKEKEIKALEDAKDEQVKIMEDEIETTKSNYQTKIDNYEAFKTTLEEMQNMELDDLRTNVSDKITELQKYSDAWKEHSAKILEAQASLSNSGLSSSSTSSKSGSSSSSKISSSDAVSIITTTGGSDSVNDARKKLLQKLLSGTHHNGIDDGVFMGGKPFDSKTEAIVKVLKNQEVPFTKPQLYQIIPNVAQNLIKGIFNNQNNNSQQPTKIINLNNVTIKADNPMSLLNGIEQLILQNS
jgi:TP901 family phage tail tape measure protein